MEELPVFGSEEEADDLPDVDSDEDATDVEEGIHEEVMNFDLLSYHIIAEK